MVGIDVGEAFSGAGLDERQCKEREGAASGSLYWSKVLVLVVVPQEEEALDLQHHAFAPLRNRPRDDGSCPNAKS